MSERMSLLEFLKERSGIRLSKLEAYLDLVDKASVQYIPKDLCKQEFSLSNGAVCNHHYRTGRMLALAPRHCPHLHRAVGEDEPDFRHPSHEEPNHHHPDVG